MPETLNLNYYYGNEADQYSFYRIPKILLTDRRFRLRKTSSQECGISAPNNQ